MVNPLSNASIDRIPFDHGFELRNVNAMEKKVGLFGRTLPTIYASLYNMNAKRRNLDSRVFCHESKVYTTSSDVYSQVVNAKKISRTIASFSKWKIFQSKLKYQGEAKFFASQQVKDAFKSIISTKPTNRSKEAKITLKHIVGCIQEYSLNSFAKTGSLGAVVDDYLALEKETLNLAPDSDTKSNLSSEHFFKWSSIYPGTFYRRC